MEFEQHHAFILNDKSYISILKREIRHYAEKIGFTKGRLGEIEIIVSELTSNLFKHAHSGQQIIFKEIKKGNLAGIEIIAMDNGPGMNDPLRMMEDGVSTAGSLGQGLGAIKRFSHEFDIYSIRGWGTIILCRYYNEIAAYARIPDHNKFDIKAVIVPKPGETACGDGWVFKQTDDSVTILASDGLGHGPEAQKASEAAAACFLRLSYAAPLPDQLSAIHEAIRSTRGIVGAILRINSLLKTSSFCGVGNINAKVLTLQGAKNFLSYNGIIGLNKPRTINEQDKEIEEGQIFILSSDGLQTRWDLTKYPQIMRHDCSIIAAALYKDFYRRTDDVLIIVAKIKKISA